MTVKLTITPPPFHPYTGILLDTPTCFPVLDITIVPFIDILDVGVTTRSDIHYRKDIASETCSTGQTWKNVYQNGCTATGKCKF